MESASTPNFDTDLPNEIWFLIIEQIQDPKSCAHLYLAARSFRARIRALHPVLWKVVLRDGPRETEVVKRIVEWRRVPTVPNPPTFRWKRLARMLRLSNTVRRTKFRLTYPGVWMGYRIMNGTRDRWKWVESRALCPENLCPITKREDVLCYPWDVDEQGIRYVWILYRALPEAISPTLRGLDYEYHCIALEKQQI